MLIFYFKLHRLFVLSIIEVDEPSPEGEARNRDELEHRKVKGPCSMYDQCISLLRTEYNCRRADCNELVERE